MADTWFLSGAVLDDDGVWIDSVEWDGTSLIAVSVETSAPTLGDETFSDAFASSSFVTAPDLFEEHSLVADGVQVAGYTFTPFQLTVGIILPNANAFLFAQPVLASTEITQVSLLSATSLDSPPADIPTIPMVLQIPLFADALESEPPEIDTTDLSQVHVGVAFVSEFLSPIIPTLVLLSAETISYADDLDIETTLDDAVLTQSHGVTGVSYIGPNAEASAPTITQSHVVVAEYQHPDYALGSPSISGVSVISADELILLSEVGTPALQVLFTPSEYLVVAELDSVAITQHHDIAAATIESTAVASPIILTQFQTLLSDDIETQIEIGDVALAQSLFPVGFDIDAYALQGSAFQSNPVGAFQEFQDDSFQIDDAFQSNAFLGFAYGILNQVHVITTPGITSTAVNGVPDITQVHLSAPSDIESTAELGQPAISQIHDIQPADADIQVEFGDAVMVQTSLFAAISLLSAAASVEQNVLFAQVHRSIVETLGLSGAVSDRPRLVQEHDLLANNLAREVVFSPTSVFSPTLIAEYDLFTAISYLFEFDPEPDSMRLLTSLSCGVITRGFFFGLPPGLTFDNGLIEGVITPSATPGFYYFEIGVTTNGVEEVFAYAIRVTNLINTSVPIVPKISWLTPTGSLGRMREGDAAYFGVEAASTTANPIVYALRSGALPPGLTVDSGGEIRGVALPVITETSFTFEIRASTSVPSTTGTPDQIAFADRTFSLTVANIFSNAVIYDLYLKPSNQQAYELKNPYTRILRNDVLFRPSDPNFGVPKSNLIYLLGGINSLEALSQAVLPDGTPTLPNTATSYHEIKRLKIGPHGVALARGVNGEVVYEVLYRLLLDPQASSGGFSFPKGETPVPVIYPDSNPFQNQRQVYPNSIRNARLDIVQKVGFGVNDIARSRSLSSERLPLWMRSRQNVNDANSALAFIPAIVIGFLKPGQGVNVERELLVNRKLIPREGTILNVNTYIVKSFPGNVETAEFLQHEY
jgi:hypothetical protein